MKRFLSALTCLVAAPAFAAPDTYPQAAEPFFKEYCFRCHDAEKQKGDFRLDNLSRDFGSELVVQDWDEVMFRINSGEMPPEDEKQPDANAVGDVIEWIAARIDEGRAARMAKRGPVTLYRLSREEYAHTIYDLLGVQFDVEAPGAFNEDPRWHGFNRIGSLLSLSPSHVERYFDAAQAIVNEAFPERPVQATTGRVEANDKRAEEWRAANDVREPIRELLLPGVPSRGSITARSAGRYRIRVRLSALSSFKGRLPHLAVWDGKVKRTLHGQDVVAPEEKPAVIEFETFLPAGRHQLMNEAPGTFEALTLSLTRDTPFTTTKERRFTHPASYKLYTDEGESIFPMLIVDWFEWEGPLLTGADRGKRDALFPESEEPAEIRNTLKRFMEKAWRRPVTDAEIDRFVRVIESERAAGEKSRPAFLAALTGILTAKNFYYLEEGSAEEKRDTVNGWELASRLSYFLWGSLPDDALFEAARSGTLRKPEILQEQLQRMLDDPKTERFLDAFPKQWLQLHKVGMFPPDPGLYPDYDAWLEQSMVLESTESFAEMFSKNLSLREFLASDWTMLNARLAMHYGLPLPEKPEFRRVALKPEHQRGGLLTQAAVLSLTSDGTRHRPVHRGVWVSEAIFGKTPPPPPPNVEPLEPTPSDEPKATVRMQLEAHATHNTCASCHRKIDPLGFAFDNYDAIGRWRTEEIVEGGHGENPKVDASGALPDGREFGGPDHFKQLLAEDLDPFAKAFVEQLATFALRRVMTIDDRDQIAAIAEASRENGYRLRDVIEYVVLSDLFQKR